MKTTIDLPDELFVAAKKKAAEERRSLRDLGPAHCTSGSSARRGRARLPSGGSR
ncbi:MAG: hypothetical protein ACRD3C_16620 [Vicinamibacterales bacterium]